MLGEWFENPYTPKPTTVTNATNNDARSTDVKGARRDLRCRWPDRANGRVRPAACSPARSRRIQVLATDQRVKSLAARQHEHGACREHANSDRDTQAKPGLLSSAQADGGTHQGNEGNESYRGRPMTTSGAECLRAQRVGGALLLQYRAQEPDGQSYDDSRDDDRHTCVLRTALYQMYPQAPDSVIGLGYGGSAVTTR